MSKQNNWLKKNMLAIITGVVLIIIIGVLIGRLQMTALEFQSPTMMLQTPSFEYRDLVRELKVTSSSSNEAVFGKYRFVITEYADDYELPVCKNPDCGSECVIKSTDKYNCVIKECTVYDLCTQCSTLVPADDECLCAVAPNTRGCGDLYCDSSEWSRSGCARVNCNPHRITCGGVGKTYVLDKAGIKWQLYYNGDMIANQTEFARENLYYYIAGQFDNTLSFKDGQLYTSATNTDYTIYRGLSGMDINGYPTIGIKFSRNFDTSKIDFDININESYIEGEEANIKVSVCNDVNELKGVLITKYEFDTFIGTIEREYFKEINIPLGCSEHMIEFLTNKSTKDIKITPTLKVYENGYSGVMVSRDYVLGKENSNFNQIILSVSDYVYMGVVNFNQTSVTIYPKYSDAYVEYLNSQYAQGKITLDELALEISKLNLTKSEYEEKLTLTEQEKRELESKIKEKNSQLIILAVLVVIVVVGMIIYITRRRKKRK